MDLDKEAETVPEDERLKKVQSSLRPARVKADVASTENKVNRPGNSYKRYRNAGELEGYAREFYEEAAGLAGLPLSSLVKCVFILERRLEIWESGERKK